MNELDGVIKFSNQHQTRPLADWADLGELQKWFTTCRRHKLIGQDATRYMGAAYGNISQRTPQGFIITGSQTGGFTELGAEHFCWVKEIDLQNNRVYSEGPIQPSSESMTHAQVYQLLPDVNFVIHVHDTAIWQQAGKLGIAETHPDAAYGTPQMASEVERLLSDNTVQQAQSLSMGGHEDGIITFGKRADDAGSTLLKLFEQCGVNS